MAYKIVIENGRKKVALPLGLGLDAKTVKVGLQSMDSVMNGKKSQTITLFQTGKKGTAPKKLLTIKVTRH